jgi:hypothetical protein
VIERILYLDGVPNMQRMNPVRVGEDPIEQHRLDLALEVDAVARYNRAIALSRDKGDNGTRALLERILQGEEHSVDWLESQLTSSIRSTGVTGEQLLKTRTSSRLPCARAAALRITPATLAWIWIAQASAARRRRSKLALDGLRPFGLVVARQILGALFLALAAAAALARARRDACALDARDLLLVTLSWAVRAPSSSVRSGSNDRRDAALFSRSTDRHPARAALVLREPLGLAHLVAGAFRCWVPCRSWSQARATRAWRARRPHHGRRTSAGRSTRWPRSPGGAP